MRRRLTMSPISSSPLSVCWRSGKATLSSRFIEPKSAPSWNRTPNFLRISKSSSSCMFGTDSPWTRTSPSSGYSRPTMCLMHTDFPVPDGPRIIEILPSGRPMFRPRRILLRPKALWTSMNSTASGTPVGRLSPVCQWYSSLLARRARPRGPTTRPRSGASRRARRGAASAVSGSSAGRRPRRAPSAASPRRLARERLVVGGPARAVLVRVLHVSLRSGLVGWRPRTAACRASR